MKPMPQYLRCKKCSFVLGTYAPSLEACVSHMQCSNFKTSDNFLLCASPRSELRT